MRKDAYRDREIELMIEHDFDKYLKLMANSEIPVKNKLILLMHKIDEFVNEAGQQLRDEAMARREMQNDRQ